MPDVVDAPIAATTWLTDAVRAEFIGAGSWTDETRLDHFLRLAAEDPAALPVVDETGSLTRGRVLADARRLAAFMTAEGIGRGDVVTLVVPNWHEFVVIHAALGLVGAVVNPLLSKLGATEMRHIFVTAGTRMVFAAEKIGRLRPADSAAAAAEGLESPVAIIPVRSTRTDIDTYESLVAGHVEIGDEPIERLDPDSWDTVTFTSGTEALPKGVVHTHRSTMFGLRAYVQDVLGLTGDDTVFMPSPICHASGLQWGLRAAIVIGAPLILQDRWDPQVALGLIDKFSCTYTLAATPFIVDMVAVGSGTSGQTLRYVASGGAPIPRHLVVAVRETFSAQLMAVFGSSETYVTTATVPGSADRLLATDGKPLPGVQVRIVGERGEVLPVLSEGEIETRGPQLFTGYLGDPDLTHRTFHGEWYRFGDLGHVDEDGMVHVTGRIKDIVIRGGENISVREIEDLLDQHPAIAKSAVVGYPDARLGERCCACIVVAGAADPPTFDEVVLFLAGRGLPTFKLPERLEVIDSMPMTATGKIRKVELREQLQFEAS